MTDLSKLKAAAEAPEYWVEGVHDLGHAVSTVHTTTMVLEKRTVLYLIARVEQLEEQAKTWTAECTKAHNECINLMTALATADALIETLRGALVCTTLTERNRAELRRTARRDYDTHKRGVEANNGD